jgi:hypothetical protein
MILRRLSQHVKDQNWLAVALDFLIVVAGVFMGLQVQEWNSARKDALEAVRVLDRLEDDFVQIRVRAERSRDGHAESLAAIARLVDAISVGELNEGTLADDIDLATRGQTPPGTSTTFQELKSNGRLELIESLELRRALSEYDDYATLVRREYRLFVEPLSRLRDRFMAVRTLDASGIPSPSFDELGATLSVDAAAILNDKGLLPQLQTGYLTHDNVHIVYVGMQARIDGSLALIRAEREAAR